MAVPDYTLLAKQPIYDRRCDCVAQELLYRCPMNLSANEVGGEIATSQVLVNYCASVSEASEKMGSLVFINVDGQFLKDHDSLPVPPDRVVIELAGDSKIDSDLLTALDNWRTKGFKFAIDGYRFTDVQASMVSALDYVKVDVLSQSIENLREKMQKEPGTVTWVATRIENEAVFEACQDLGFDLFQGYFLAKPADVTGNSIRPGTAVTIQIIKQLDQPNISMKEITDLVSRDPKLTMQMLKIINSPLFSLPRPVTDLQAALVYLGVDMLRQWAMILAFLSNGSAQLEACRLVLLRAKAAETFVFTETNDEQLGAAAFLAGLVSGVDVLLKVKPEVFLNQVKLSDMIESAVISQQGEVGEALKNVKKLEYKITQTNDELAKLDRKLLGAYDSASYWVNDVMDVLRS